MAPDGRSRESRHDGSGRANANGSDTSATEVASRAKPSRKRTKTGCLTCRKRRIKCDEERPVCKNCIKSKRHCEGYNQRVVFKPSFDYQPVAHGGAHITWPLMPPAGQNIAQQDPNQPLVDMSTYGQLRPRLDDRHYVPAFGGQSQPFLIPGAPQPYGGSHSVPNTPNEHPQPFQFAPALSTLPMQDYQFPSQVQQVGIPSQLHQRTVTMPISAGPAVSQSLAINTGHFEQSNAQNSALYVPPVTMPSEYLVQAYGPAIAYASQPEAMPLSAQVSHHDINWQDLKPTASVSDGSAAPTPVSSRSSHTLSFSQTPTMSTQPWTPSMYVPRPELARPLDYQLNVQSVSATWIHYVDGETVPP